jgi:hypothetical protein
MDAVSRAKRTSDAQFTGLEAFTGERGDQADA